MPQDVRFLTARRAYEFRPDDISLATLQVQKTRLRIQSAFNFQTATFGLVAGLFGSATIQLPQQQGLVFQNGTEEFDGKLIPIRLLQVEAARIVIDVAGPSSHIDSVFEHLTTALSDAQTSDGHPALGRYAELHDFSELSAKFRFQLTDLFHPAVPHVFKQGLGPGKQSGELVPAIYFEALAKGQAYGGIPEGESTVVRFSLRAGYKVDDHVYYSAALVGTESHVKYLMQLEEQLQRPQAPRRRRR